MRADWHRGAGFNYLPELIANADRVAAHWVLEGDDARDDVNRSQQIIRQVRTELEEVLKVLRR